MPFKGGSLSSFGYTSATFFLFCSLAKAVLFSAQRRLLLVLANRHFILTTLLYLPLAG